MNLYAKFPKGLNPWGARRPWKSFETANLISVEAAILEIVEEHQPVSTWDVLDRLVEEPMEKEDYDERKQMILSVMLRLTKEGKLTRARSHVGLNDSGYSARPGIVNTLVLGPSYVRPMRDIQDEDIETIGGDLRDVSSFGGFDEERGSVLEGRSSRTGRR